MNCKDDVEEKFIRDWNEGKVRRVSDGKRMVPEREWVGLTDDEIEQAAQGGDTNFWDFCRIIEAKLREKNA